MLTMELYDRFVGTESSKNTYVTVALVLPFSCLQIAILKCIWIPNLPIHY